MKAKKNLYSNLEEFLNDEEKQLNTIFEELINNNEDKSAIKKFDRIIKTILDCKGLLPCSKSFKGDYLLTFSKLWMILILLKITKGKTQQNDFLTLVNSSLTHDLDDYEEYREFFDEQCEILFSDEDAINRINLNPKLSNKLDNNISHEELKNYYIYLLYRPNYFQKIDLNSLPKIKTIDRQTKKNRKSENSKDNKNKTKNKSDNTSKVLLESSEEDDEKGDRLDENDMVSKKNRAKEPSYQSSNKNKSNKYQKQKNQKNKKVDEKNDSDDERISAIINGTIKNIKKRDEIRKSAKKQKTKSSPNQSDIEEEREDEDINMTEESNKKGKKNKNQKKSSANDKKNKDIKKNKKNYKKDLDEEEFSNKKDNKYKRDNKAKDIKNKNDRKSRKTINRKKGTNKIFEILGIENNDEEKVEEKKSGNKKSNNRKSVSMPPQKKSKDKGKKKEDKDKNNKNKNKNKDKDINKKSSGKKKAKPKKNKKPITDDESFFSSDEDPFLSNLSELDDDDSDIVGDDLDKLDEKEKKKMEREIQQALNGNIDFLDLDEILGDSNMEGESLNKFNSKDLSSNDIDMDELDEDFN